MISVAKTIVTRTCWATYEHNLERLLRGVEDRKVDRFVREPQP